MKQYYIHTGKEQLGPFTHEQLQERGITRNTLIWYDGLDDWTEADRIFVFPPMQPPPLNKKRTIVNDNAEDEERSIEVNRMRALLVISWIIVSVVANDPFIGLGIALGIVFVVGVLRLFITKVFISIFVIACLLLLGYIIYMENSGLRNKIYHEGEKMYVKDRIRNF